MSERTRIQLCGRLSIELDGVQLAQALRGRQVPLLFAYLVLHRERTVGREELIGALWPDEAPASQDGALRTLLSRLRSAIGADSVSGRDELALTLPDPIWIDREAALAELERARDALGAHDHRSAWALAQIPLNVAGRGLLPGAHADWLEPFREELVQARLAALEVIGAAGLNLGPSQLASAERAARALIAAEPFRERGHVLLMRALAARGDTAEALRAYDALRTRLREELGTPPSAETIAVYEALLVGEPGPSPAPPPPQPDKTIAGDASAVPLPGELIPPAAHALVGRNDELGGLLARWSAARRGICPGEEARLVLLSGEPGIGKTRLLAELASRAHADGGIVLAGRAPEEAVVPYQPFLEALRHYIRHADTAALQAAASEHGPELARLVPELRRRLPGLAQPVQGESETERYRLFEAVVGLLTEVARGAPVLLVLDDLQWTDRPSRLLLRHLTRAARPDRLLIVSALRSTDAETERLESELAPLRRDGLLAEVAITGLTEAETGELVGRVAGEPPRPDFARALHAETEGNPFFVEEIVRALAESGVSAATASADALADARLPDGVRHVIVGRLDRLSPEAVDVLRVAAVVGRDFDTELVEQIAGLGEDAFLEALDAGFAAGLITEAAQRPRFSHALIRETIYTGLSRPRRDRLHRRVGEALLARRTAPPNPRRERSSGDAGALALHFARAGDAERAIAFAREAALHARALLAYEEATEHLQRALDVSEAPGPADPAEQLALLLELAETHVLAGERGRARPAFLRAATLAEALGDEHALARAAVGASRRYIQPPGVVDTELIELLERALERLGPAPTSQRALLIARLCGAIYYTADAERMSALAAEAMRIAEAVGDDESRAYAFAARRRAMWRPDELGQRVAAATGMLAMAQRIGNQELVLQAHAWLVVDLLEQGDLAGVEAQRQAFDELAGKIRQPFYTWQSLVWQAMLAMLAGRLADGEELALRAAAAGAPAEGLTAPHYLAIQLLAIRREQGRFAELEDAARELVGAHPDRPTYRTALAALLQETGREAEARSVLASVIGAGVAAWPRDGDWLTGITLAADVACGLGDAELAAALYDELAPLADSVVVIALGAVCLGSVKRFLGTLRATTGDLMAARALLEDALETNARLSAPVPLAHTRLDLAAVLEALESEPSRVAELRKAAEEQAQTLDLGKVRARLESAATLRPRWARSS